jgi:hypothetical protein
VEAHRAIVEETIEGSRQHMLASVLLHVIEASRPIDLTGDCGSDRKRRRQDMSDVVIEIDRVEDVYRGPKGSSLLWRYPTHIEWLPTGGWIERRSIEQCRRASFMLDHAGHDSLETTAVRVGVVDPGGHAASADAAGRSK